jgi:hypothetical protein
VTLFITASMSALCLIRVFVLEKHVNDLEIRCQSSESLITLLQQRIDRQILASDEVPAAILQSDNSFTEAAAAVNQSRVRRSTSGGQCVCPAGPPGEPGKRGKRGKKGDAGPPVSAHIVS